MRAMVLEQLHAPLQLRDLPIPRLGPNQLLLRVRSCAVCRTDLHIIEGELPPPHLPLILGHQIVGTVIEKSSNVTDFRLGQRVGVPWLGKACSNCSFCLSQRENLCYNAQFTGYHLNGGFAEYCVVNADYALTLPRILSDLEIAPLLCGGLIGYRAYKMLGNAQRIGFYGFGSSAYILTQLAIYQNKEVYVFTREGDKEAQDFALSLGVKWAGSSNDPSPVPLDASIIFAPVGNLIPKALKDSERGASIVCAGIYMTEIPPFDYSLLWGERIIRSVANLTREDGHEFFNLIAKIPVRGHAVTYPLERANDALEDLKEGRLIGTAVLKVM